MIKKWMGIIFILVAGGILYCQNNYSEVNGFEWEKWNSPEKRIWKLQYIRGIFDGHYDGYTQALLELLIMHDDVHLDKNKVSKMISNHKYMEGLTFGQIVDGIDKTYKNIINKYIPVIHLTDFVCRWIKGTISNEDYELNLRTLREGYNK